MGTYSSCYGLWSTAFSHIFCILRWSETYLGMYGLLRTASLHIYCVFKRSGTRTEFYFLVLFLLLQCTSICCVVKRSGHIYLWPWAGRGSNFMNRKNNWRDFPYSFWHTQVTSKWSFIDVKNDEHTPKNDDSVIETIPRIGHLST